MNDLKVPQKDIKKVFWKLGACSHTLFYILNREFGYPLEAEERASDPLAGGINQQGYQCGMLWGAALATGAEAFRRSENHDQAIGMAITAAQYLLASFVNRTRSADCADITSCDFSSKLSMAKYMLTGRFLSCFDLAQKWAPEAVRAATEGLSHQQATSQPPISCASEIAKKMGASDEQVVMVAGFAGGLGLSGNACGALSAAIWMNVLAALRENNSRKPAYPDPIAARILESFYRATDYEILCHKISGRCFKTIDEHTEYIKNGGCDKLMSVLAQSQFGEN